MESLALTLARKQIADQSVIGATRIGRNKAVRQFSVGMWPCCGRFYKNLSQIDLFHPCMSPYISSCLLYARPCKANMNVHSLLPSFPQGILITVLGLLLYALVRIIYNLFFHPLTHFPGPRGAACTRWWLAYQEIGRGVSLSTLRAELHQQYGTPIHVSPF